MFINKKYNIALENPPPLRQKTHLTLREVIKTEMDAQNSKGV